MSSGKPYHFRSGEKISKNTFGFPRKSADRDHNDPVIPIRYTADHQYFNRRVHTQNHDDEDLEFGKAVQKLGFESLLSRQKVMRNLKNSQKERQKEREKEREKEKYESLYGKDKQRQKRSEESNTKVLKPGGGIGISHLYQGNRFLETKPKKQVGRMLLTETGGKINSQDKFFKKQNKRLFDRLLLSKDKSIKNQIIKSSKSKENRDKFVSGNLRQKPFFGSNQNEGTQKISFKESLSLGLKEMKKERLIFENLDNNTSRQPKPLKTETIQVPKPQIQILQKVGQGTFGQVFKAKLGNKIVAVKKVFQDKKYKNRQLQILGMINNDFVLNVIETFYTQQKGNKGQPPKDYLNVVMEYYEQNLFEVNSESQQALSQIQLKLFIYQLFRGLMYIHSLQICHRDIKPQNILVNRRNGKLVICDFGSAKKLIKNQSNIAYICSRCYRAPQLIFGCTNYTTMIDIWSAGCVLLQLLTGEPFFIGDSNIGQLVEIIKILGTPSKTEVINMNSSYDLDDYKFPKIKTKQWKQIFPKIDQELESLLKQIMIYSPKQRLNAAEALCHQYFDELRDENTYNYLRQKRQIKPLFDFTKQQLKNNEHLAPKLIPDWYENLLF